MIFDNENDARCFIFKPTMRLEWDFQKISWDLVKNSINSFFSKNIVLIAKAMELTAMLRCAIISVELLTANKTAIRPHTQILHVAE